MLTSAHTHTHFSKKIPAPKCTKIGATNNLICPYEVEWSNPRITLSYICRAVFVKSNFGAHQISNSIS